jgi:hypothetical protein
VASSGEFWINNSGTNLLTGVDGDPNNPVQLHASFILDFLVRIPSARASFDRLYPNLLPAEQARLDPLANSASQGLIRDPIEESDELMQTWNTAGVRRGGGFMQRHVPNVPENTHGSD